MNKNAKNYDKYHNLFFCLNLPCFVTLSYIFNHFLIKISRKEKHFAFILFSDIQICNQNWKIWILIFVLSIGWGKLLWLKQENWLDEIHFFFLFLITYYVYYNIQAKQKVNSAELWLRYRLLSGHAVRIIDRYRSAILEGPGSMGQPRQRHRIRVSSIRPKPLNSIRKNENQTETLQNTCACLGKRSITQVQRMANYW